MFAETATGLVLVGQHCRVCGKVAFPHKRVCPSCFGEALEDQPLSSTGVLHTFTCTHVGAPHLPTPYLLGFVDLPEGIRLLSLLTECDPWEEVLTVGMSMEMVIRPLMTDPSGEELHTFKFRPASASEATSP